MEQPKVAIVIPVFKHSVLVSEAIVCALNQETELSMAIVIVNDGCTFAETDRICRDFAYAYPNRIFYIYRPNGGLSAARNTGIDFVLNTWESVEAIYLLDADNRIVPKTIDRAYKMLLAHPEIGWVYPTINMFGQEFNGDYRGDYCVLRHLRFNVSEAGSMVRRAVFAAGCRYDEAMKLGFEDWEFWWQAIEAGFRGKHLPEFGFQYRKRLESMLRDSERDRDGIFHYMQRKHRNLFTHRHLVALEQQEAPRYAIFLSDTAQVLLTSDPTRWERSVTIQEFREIYQRAQLSPNKYHCPYFLTFTRTNVLEFLQEKGLLRWVFWRLEIAQEFSNFANVNLDIAPHHQGIRVREEEEEQDNPVAGHTDLLVMTSIQIMNACLRDPYQDWIQSLATEHPMPKIFKLKLELFAPNSSDALTGGAIYHLLSVFKSLRSLNWMKEPLLWDWHTSPFLQRSLMFSNSRWALESNAVYPILADAREKHLGIILPLLEFGGVEKVALNIAKVFYEAGWKIHLFVFSDRLQQLPDWAEVFTTINFYWERDMETWNGPLYMGSKYDTWSASGDHKTPFGLFSWLDAVINFHTCPANSLMGLLRRARVKTIASLHVHDLSHWNRIKGHSYLTIGYEHAYDYVMTCSQQMLDWCHAIGVPEDKLVLVPNQCGYPLEELLVQKSLQRRWVSHRKEGLKILFIGRFDRQKGIDRLVKIIQAIGERQLPVQWRLVGKNVIRDENVGRELEPILNYIESPVSSSESLSELYEWADILLLPSYWEGLPLSVIEAMRLGAVPCASDVGAVKEAIAHGINGILIPNLMGDAFVEKTVCTIAQLIEFPEKLKQLSQAAAQSISQKNWSHSCLRLLEVLGN